VHHQIQPFLVIVKYSLEIRKLNKIIKHIELFSKVSIYSVRHMDTPTKINTYLFTFSPKGITKNYDYSYMDHYQKYFKNWKACMEDYEINPELNASGNLHYHGYYVLKDKYKWFKSVLPRMKYEGNLKIDIVTADLSKAMVYCRKDRDIMLKLITARPLPITKENCKMEIDKDLVSNTLIDYLIEVTNDLDTK